MKKFKRILLVDDDDTSNMLNTMIISNMDITEDVDVASNGEEALSHLVKHCQQAVVSDKKCPELILLDINMPVMDGFEFLEAYKEKLDIHNKVPVVMLSSSSNKKDFEKALSYNVKGYIVKPLSEDKLQELF